MGAEHRGTLVFVLRSATQGHDRKMAPAFVLVDVECKVIARLASDKRRRFGARGRTRPTCTGLDSRFAIGRSQAKIDFVGRPPFKRRVRTMFVVPIDERKKLPTTCFSTAGNQNSSSALVLHALDHTFNHGDASMLADRAVPRRLDALALDPTPKGTAVKDGVPVTDNVFRRCVSAMDRSA